ncbi:unnamed protein product [Spirodela intermedia]|uniref:Uncharacterized protein n=1 Tax=Spirodela intermedia TaxID=51605 RepID=A0A7I8I9I4_SPIIN|nr:unnamed protein product [Spirodela intermedia]CAA6654250.1 unnamed protein product [Spirodela intermedia]
MEITHEEDPQSSEIPLDDKDQLLENAVQFIKMTMETKFNMSDEEIKEIMEPIAATGKFWHEWDELKSILSFRLKQVLAEYPESQVDNDVGSQDESLTGETYSELVRRLDEALLSFIEGPPFTLQRLCEILLAPRSLYPKLSKLALALDKNLLVTSTLTRSTAHLPCPSPRSSPRPSPG